MHLFIADNRLDLSLTETIEPGVEYVADDIMAAQLAVACNGAQMQPFTKTRPFDETKDWNGKKIIFLRAGGFGDLILLTPVLREIKRRWPDVEITVATMGRYAPVLRHLPFVCDHTISPPVRHEALENYDAWVFFENAIERNPKAKTVHMTDLFAEIAGLSSIRDKRPDYALTDNEKIWALEGYPKINGVKRLGIQVKSGARSRSYPGDQLNEIITQMVKSGWEVFLMGIKGEMKVEENHRLRNLSDAGLTFRQSAAVIWTCDCVLGPDSSLLHVAGALGIPAVGLYGPFPWKLRTSYCETTFSLQGEGACAPCFFHEVPRQNPFPLHGPCQKTGQCEVLASIKPDRVVQKIEQVVKKLEDGSPDIATGRVTMDSKL